MLKRVEMSTNLYQKSIEYDTETDEITICSIFLGNADQYAKKQEISFKFDEWHELTYAFSMILSQEEFGEC